MSLSDDQVRRIARLARIDVRDEEVRAVAERLDRVLAMIDAMRAVDTRGIEPMSHPLDEAAAAGQRLREDAATEHDRREAFQAIAPAVEGGLYLVPKVIE